MAEIDAGSAHFLAANPEIGGWVEKLRQAAGPQAWIDVKINFRGGTPREVQVLCGLKWEAKNPQGG